MSNQELERLDHQAVTEEMQQQLKPLEVADLVREHRLLSIYEDVDYVLAYELEEKFSAESLVAEEVLRARMRTCRRNALERELLERGLVQQRKRSRAALYPRVSWLDPNKPKKKTKQEKDAELDALLESLEGGQLGAGGPHKEV